MKKYSTKQERKQVQATNSINESSGSSENEEQDEKEIKITSYQRKFQNCWLIDYKWCAKKNNKPYCKICHKIMIPHSSNLKRHESTKVHKRNVDKLEKQVCIEKSKRHRQNINLINSNSNIIEDEKYEEEEDNIKNSNSTPIVDITDYGWAKPSENDSNMIYCTICNKDLNVTAGNIILLRHENTSSHQKNAQDINFQSEEVEEEHLYEYDTILEDNNDMDSECVMSSAESNRGSELNEKNTNNVMNLSNNHQEDECDIIGKRFAWHFREMNKNQRLFAEIMCNKIMHLGRMNQLKKKQQFINNFLNL